MILLGTVLFLVGLLVVLITASYTAVKTAGKIQFIDFIQLGSTLAKLPELLDARVVRKINFGAGVGVTLIFVSWCVFIADLVSLAQ